MTDRSVSKYRRTMAMSDDALESQILALLDAGKTQLADCEYHQAVSHYTDPAMLAAERAALFSRFPLVVATSVEMPEPGSFRTVDIEDQSILARVEVGHLHKSSLLS